MSRDRIVFRSSDAGALPPTQVLRYGAPSLDCPGDHRRNHRWKVAGDLAWGEYRSTSFSSSRPSQSPVISRPRFTHSVPYSSFFLHLSSARRSGLLSTLPSEPDSQLQKLWRRPNTLGPRYLKNWRGRVPRGGCAYAGDDAV